VRTVILSAGSEIVGATPAFTLTGSGLADGAGAVVSAAGDINGDGFADLMVSAPLSDATGLNAGAVYILFGKNASISSFAANYDLGTLAPADGLTLTGAFVNGTAGMIATNVGDVSGDGIDDILIGGLDANGLGAAYLVFGGTGITSMNLSAINGSNGYVFDGVDLGLFAPAFTAAGLGDVNNDSINDIALGAADAGAAGNGKVIGILGGAENLAALDGLDRATNGHVDMAAFLNGTPPTAAFITTNNNVTMTGTTTGTIDLRVSGNPVGGEIGITDITDPTATFDIVNPGNEGTGTYGTLVVEDDGIMNDLDRWVYTLGGASLLFLGAGEIVQDQIILTASNGSERAINITITGADDPVQVTKTDDVIGFAPTEDLSSFGGAFALFDPDQNDNPDLSGQTLVGTYGSFTVSADGSRFTYVLNPDLPDLGFGTDRTEHITDQTTGVDFTFTIQSRDETVTGANQGPDYQLAGANPGEGVTVFFGAGNEVITGTGGNDVIDTGAGDDTVSAGAGNDTVTDAFGNDTVSGGAGDDTVILLSGTNTINDIGGLVADSNYFKGGVGRDTITGGAGIDYIDGDAASNMIGAADRLDGGLGDDYLRGGLGADVFVFNNDGSHDTIADFDAVYAQGVGYQVNGPLGRDFDVGIDTVELVGFATPAAPITDFITYTGGNAILDLEVGVASATLTLYGVGADELTVDSFVFV